MSSSSWVQEAARLYASRYWRVHRRRFYRRKRSNARQRAEIRFFNRRLKRGVDDCPRCGSEVHRGFGLAMGGFGPYWWCPARWCGWTHKVRMAADEE